MSARVWRTLPTLFRVGFYDALAYRAEALIWTLATTMPLVMLALWSAVAHDAPMGRFGAREFSEYFLITFIVRQFTGAWVSWQINMEVRNGTFGLRLLRPLHPFIAYGAEQLAAIPLRACLSVPMALGMLWMADRKNRATFQGKASQHAMNRPRLRIHSSRRVMGRPRRRLAGHRH